MGSFAAIPQIEANVAVPTTTRPFRPSPGSNVPEIKSAIGGAAEGLAQGGEQLGKILAIQAEHQKILDTEQARQTAQALHEQIATEASHLPGNQQAPYVQEKLTEAFGNIINDPANQHIKGALENTLPHVLNMAVINAKTAGAEQTFKDQNAQAELLNANRANQMSQPGRYQFLPESGTFKDDPISENIHQQVYNDIDKRWGNSPDRAAAEKQLFDHQLMDARLRGMALNDPATLMHMRLPPEGVDPTQFVKYRDMAYSQFGQAEKQSDAMLKGIQEQTKAPIVDAMVNGTLTVGQLEAQRHNLPVDFYDMAYRRLTDHNPAPMYAESNPDVVNQLDSGILNGSTSKDQITMAMMAGQINSKTHTYLSQKLESYDKFVKNDLGQAMGQWYINLDKQIRGLDPHGHDARRAKEHGQETASELAKSQYELMQKDQSLRTVSDVQAREAAIEKQFLPPRLWGAAGTPAHSSLKDKWLSRGKPMPSMSIVRE